MKSFLSIILLLLIFSCSNQKKILRVNADQDLTGQFTTSPMISSDDILYYISNLCSDSLEGRRSGTRGEGIAAEFIRDRFIEFGLSAFENNYFQKFSFYSWPIFMARVPSVYIDKVFKESGEISTAALGKIEQNKAYLDTLIMYNLDKSSSVGDTLQSQNVVAYMEGNDTILNKEYIIVGAHYDHIGKKVIPIEGNSGEISFVFDGADDNASGVAGLIELAEKIAHTKQILKRSVIFVAFGAEEQGLKGSNYFCNHLPVPLDKIKLMINLDMVGRMDLNNTLDIYTMSENSEQEKRIKEIPLIDNLNLKFKDEMIRNSDHFPFYIKKIPVAFFTTGIHNQYHSIGDSLEILNTVGERKVMDLVYELIKLEADTLTVQ